MSCFQLQHQIYLAIILVSCKTSPRNKYIHSTEISLSLKYIGRFQPRTLKADPDCKNVINHSRNCNKKTEDCTLLRCSISKSILGYITYHIITSCHMRNFAGDWSVPVYIKLTACVLLLQDQHHVQV